MLQKIRKWFTFPSMVHIWFPQIKLCVNFNYLATGLCMNLKCCFSDFHVGFLMKTGTNECAGTGSCECLWVFLKLLFICQMSMCCLWNKGFYMSSMSTAELYKKKSIIKYLNCTFPRRI